MIQSVYIERDDENEGPPSHVLKVSFFSGGYDPRGEFMPPVVYFAIGDYDERTYEDSFRTSDERQFSVTLEDLIGALWGLGAVLRVETKVDLNAT